VPLRHSFWIAELIRSEGEGERVRKWGGGERELWCDEKRCCNVTVDLSCFAVSKLDAVQLGTPVAGDSAARW